MRKDRTVTMKTTQPVGRSIEKEIVIHASPHRVFKALTHRDELDCWFAKKAELDLRQGSAISLEWDQAAGIVERGMILTLHAPQRLSYAWEAFSPRPTTLTCDVTAGADGTRLRFTQTGIGDGADWDAYYTAPDSGWSTHLHNLTAWLETGNCARPGPTGTLAQSVTS